MELYKQQFIEFMVQCQVLTFGDFTTKSGRKTPFFINTGKYKTGSQMERLGHYYAAAIAARFGSSCNVLFGPAYKGIPLVVAAGISLAREFNQDVAYCYNRKEAKDHGEGGVLVGHKLVAGDTVVMLDDVVTAGTSVRETLPLLTAVAGVTVKGLVVSVDRMERGTGEKSALQEIRATFGIDAFAIVTLDEVVEHLHGRAVDGTITIDDAMKQRIDDYRAQYGVKE